MRLLTLAVLAALVSLQVRAGQVDDAAESNRKIGGMVARFLQTSYILEILTTRECSKYALRPHSATSDYNEILDGVSKFYKDKVERSELEKVIQNTARDRRAYAESEVADFSTRIGRTSTSLEFRCGMLLGMTSMSYLSARSMWAGFNDLEKPVWQRP